MKNVAVLMAGGKSERLWPLSRVNMPKQFLDLTGDGITMLQRSVNRLLPLIPLEDIYIATNALYKDIVIEQLPGLPQQNILLEPMARNTAPCIAFATTVLREKYGDAVMVVLASDHVIGEEDIYLDTLRTASDFAATHDALVTLGIQPEYPETGYGYIRYDACNQTISGLFPVEAFVEKPNQPTADQYIREGNYLWNSGMFIWRLSYIERCFAAYMPDTHEAMKCICSSLRQGDVYKDLADNFLKMESTSIDYGILEKSDAIYTLPGRFTWVDVGNWTALHKLFPADGEGNVFDAETFLLRSEDCIVKAPRNKKVILMDVKDLVVVDTDDVLLVMPRDNIPRIKELLGKLREQGSADLL